MLPQLLGATFRWNRSLCHHPVAEAARQTCVAPAILSHESGPGSGASNIGYSLKRRVRDRSLAASATRVRAACVRHRAKSTGWQRAMIRGGGEIIVLPTASARVTITSTSVRLWEHRPMTKTKMRARALQSTVGSRIVTQYGSWKSPITSNLITRQSIKLSETSTGWKTGRMKTVGVSSYVRRTARSIRRPLAHERKCTHTAEVPGSLTMATSISATCPTVGCIGKIETLRSRSRSHPRLLRRKKIGAMPTASLTEPGTGGSECARIIPTPIEIIPTMRLSLSL